MEIKKHNYINGGDKKILILNFKNQLKHKKSSCCMKRVTRTGRLFLKTKDPEGNNIELWGPKIIEFDWMKPDTNSSS